MASGDTKTQQYLDVAANGTRADVQHGCCETRTQSLIMDVADRIITEEETRAREDQILQGEIDEIRNNPDVADIVPTYAALQDYDTSTLTDKDIIRVLADETHGGASTYYRWSTSSETFTYVGETGDYYTKSQVDDLLDDKQDELTAGENITIEDESGALVISATDTTYSNFTGTDGTAAGSAGLVPAPATTDAGKFLKADGTWDDAAGSTYTAGDGINISAQDVISATNTGKARILTTADYNYPANNPTSVALWLLDEGIYQAGDSAIAFKPTSTKNEFLYAHNMLIVTKANDNKFATMGIYPTSGNSNTLTVTKVRTADGNVMVDGSLPTGVVDKLTSTSTTSALSAYQGKVLKGLIDAISQSGAGAPTTSTVGTVGQLYQDTTNGKLYICTAIVPGADPDPDTYTWTEVGAGGSGGGAVELTSADYNYHYSGTTDDGLAPWLLEPGMYYIKGTPASPIRIYNSSSSASSFTQNESLIINKTTVGGSPMTNVISYTDSGNIWSVDYNASGTHAKEGKIITNNNLVSSTGTSTTDVMSQNAVTSMVFADPANKTKVKLGGVTVSGDYAVGIGFNGTINIAAPYGVHIGSGGGTTNGSSAVGFQDGKADGAHSVAFSGGQTSTQGVFTIGLDRDYAQTYGYNNSAYRLLTGLYDPQSAHDAATKGYVDGLVGDIDAALDVILNGEGS